MKGPKEHVTDDRAKSVTLRDRLSVNRTIYDRIEAKREKTPRWRPVTIRGVFRVPGGRITPEVSR